MFVRLLSQIAILCHRGVMSESESTLNSSCSSSDDSTSAHSDPAPTVVDSEPYGAEPEWTEEELVARAAQSSKDHSEDEQEEDIDVFFFCGRQQVG